MPALFVYLVKLSLSLAVVFLFYQLTLRRLTFYNWNRVYLLGYTLLSFVIPFIDISQVLEKNNWTDSNIVAWVPSIVAQNPATSAFTEAAKPVISGWDIALIIITAGMIVLLLKFLFQLISYSKMKTKATGITVNGLNIYQVDENIIPFSFGNSIFINRRLHTQKELQEIIQHEFIHVKQKHSFDIIWGEILCLLNWYNPFVWLLKKSIRQNLEFIADNKVIENGLDKKQYQYLLLKVIGNNQFSIASHFNFSSLKKRIAMMNKTKSAKQQMARFLFLVPVLAIILISFRKSFTDSAATLKGNSTPVFTDTVPEVKEVNSKGYFIDIKDNKGNCLVVIKDKDKKEVKRLLLTEWNERTDYYENLYGEIPPPSPPPPPAKPALPTKEQWLQSANPDVKLFSLNNNLATVILRNGKSESYDLNNADQKKTFENKYGKLPEPPQPPAPAKAVQPAGPVSSPQPPAPPSKIIGIKPKGGVTADFDLEDDVMTVNLKDGRKEIYNLKNEKEKKLFTEKYGEPVLAESISTPGGSGLNNLTVTAAPLSEKTIGTTTIAARQPTEATIASGSLTNIKLSPALATTAGLNNLTLSGAQPAITSPGEAEVLIRIKESTTETELDELVKAMKAKGYELKFTDKNFDNGKLTAISGIIKYKGSSTSFSADDFNDLTITIYREGESSWFKVLTNTSKRVI